MEMWCGNKCMYITVICGLINLHDFASPVERCLPTIRNEGAWRSWRVSKWRPLTRHWLGSEPNTIDWGTPHDISETNGRTAQRATQRSKALVEMQLTHPCIFGIEVTCQIKVGSQSGVFRSRVEETTKWAFFVKTFHKCSQRPGEGTDWANLWY